MSCLLGAAFLAASLAACVTEKENHAKLEAQAKISRPEAERIALAKVPNGTVKEGELEKEKGQLIWSFDISTPDSQNITEVHVDAVSGVVLNTEQETPAQQAKEKK
jgi:uncharacterized membrane protein YkoI